MEQLRHPLTCLVAGSLVVAGGMIAGPFAVGAVAGGLIATIGSEAIAELAGRGWSGWCQRVFDREVEINHHLLTAFQRGFQDAAKRLKQEWFAEFPHKRQQQWSGDRRAADRFFKELGENADLLLTDAWLGEVAEDADALRAFRGGGGDALTAFNLAIDGALTDSDPDLIEFLRDRLAKRVAECFQEQLKRNDKDGTAAHRAYEFLVYDQLLANDAEIRAILIGVATNQQQVLKEWSKTVKRLRRGQGKLAAQIRADLRETATWIVDETFDRVKKELNRRFGEPGITDVAKPAAGRNPTTGNPRPRIWQVPHRWNDYFVGRRDLLDRLVAEFAAGAGPAVVVQAIQGLGGLGKTQLAVRFAYERAADYDGVWWIKSESAATLATDFAALAEPLGLPITADADVARRVALVLAYLERTRELGERWLLIFDNASPRFRDDDERGALEPYLPRRGACDVLITSRERDWDEVAAPHDLGDLPLDQATEFLLQRTGQKDRPAAELLAKELGRLPLALEQAGAFIRDKRGLLTLTDYLDRFRRQPLDRLQMDPARLGELGADFRFAATTWLISFDEVARRSRPAADLLTLCAFFAPEAIPLDDLIAGADLLPESLAATLRDPDGAVAVVELLLRFSLAEWTGERTLSVHRLVQLVARETLTDAERRDWAERAVRLTRRAFPYDPDDQRTWDPTRRRLDHARAAVDQAERAGVARDVSDSLLFSVGQFLINQGLYADAEATLERALAISEELNGPDHVSTAIDRLELSRSQWHLGKLTEARANNEQALVVLSRELGPEDPRVLTGINNLAEVLRAQGDLAGARARHEQALAIWQTRGDRYQEGVTFYNLGELAIAMERRIEGLRLLAICYVIDREIGHADADSDLAHVRSRGAEIGLSDEQIDRLIEEVARSYAEDRGWRLLGEAFPEA